MRNLQQAERAEVAKESIIRLREANNLSKRTDRIRQEHLDSWLDDEPTLTHAGESVQLCVTSTHLNVFSKETRQIIIQHEMRNVSFASSGDEDTVDFIAYVAKDPKFGRACFVLECGYETAKNALETIARGFRVRTEQYHQSNFYNNATLPNSRGNSLNLFCNTINNLNQHDESVIALTRSSLEKEPWFHGSYLSREDSEARLQQDGDFLVRESMLDPGHFVLSVMHDGTKLHLLFDSMGQVRTREMVFKNVSHLVKYHHDEASPIVADNRFVYLRKGVKPKPTNK